MPRIPNHEPNENSSEQPKYVRKRTVHQNTSHATPHHTSNSGDNLGTGVEVIRSELLPTVQQHIEMVAQIRIKHDQFLRITESIKRCHQINKLNSPEPQCILLTGASGAGKSTILASYAHMHPRGYSDGCVRVPALYVTIPSNATVSALVTALLYALGDPRFDKGTLVARTFRLKNLFRDCGVELLMLDEAQHFYDKDSQKVLQNASNWLKEFIKSTGVACVLSGLQGEAEQVVNVNPQLGRLFGDPYVLEPFLWSDESEDANKPFRDFLCEMEELLPLSQPSNLGRSRRVARSIYIASSGLVAYLMALIRQATYLALLEGRDHLGVELLAAAFDARLAGERRGIPNPFVGWE